MYLLKEDVLRCKQLIMRGADINYSNKYGFTPLHFGIEKQVSDKMVKFLLKAGANPHHEDIDGKDCCDKANDNDVYHNILSLHDFKCMSNPALRIKFTDA